MSFTVCEEKKKLFDTYRDAAKAHAESLADLQKRMGTSFKTDYDTMYERTDVLRNDATKAKAALDSHVAAHKC